MSRPPLRVLDGEFAVCRLEPDAPIPQWAHASSFQNMTRTPNELSIVCLASCVPKDVRAKRGWRAIEFIGPLDFALVGVLNAVLSPLAQADISVFALSTFDTDFVLVRESEFERARQTLVGVGFEFSAAR